MRIWIVTTLFILAGSSLLAGGKYSPDNEGKTFIGTGDLKTDILSLSHQPLNILAARGNDVSHTKSPFLAAGLSAVLPGAGEFYSESYWKSALFIAVEAAVWTVNIIYNNKGDKQENFYKQYANEHWSVVRYAEWINTNLKYLSNGELDPLLYTIPVNPDPSLPPRERVDWIALNRTEQAIGGGFSHSLAKYGDQQYYEMIGKYLQFVHGWDQTDSNSPDEQITPQLTWYAGQRGKANDFYNVASTATTIVVLNHVLSAFDAAWSAHSYNKIHSEVTMEVLSTPQGVVVFPTLKFRVSF
jgi:hypothetical protein